MSLLASALVAHMPVALLGFNLEDILISTGPWVLVVSAIIVFIESGVLFPVLPGDSLIFALGMLHDRMGLSLWLAFPVLIVAAVAGGEVGYQLGARYGRNLFKDDAKFLSTKNLHAAEEFFAKRGGVALVLGRFVPIVRTFVSLAAGLSSYPRRKFNLWNILGAVLWIGLIGTAGVLLGGIEFVHKNIELLAVIIVLVSVVPVAIEYIHGRKKEQKALSE